MFCRAFALAILDELGLLNEIDEDDDLLCVDGSLFFGSKGLITLPPSFVFMFLYAQSHGGSGMSERRFLAFRLSTSLSVTASAESVLSELTTEAASEEVVSPV